MPIFEYMCVRCGSTFEKLVRSSGPQEIVCPKCQSTTVQKQMSSFAVKGVGGAGALAGGTASGGVCAPGGG
jgi:putative FmdB family regulatory protein